jgi:cytochrome c oxidase subunit III
MTEAGHDRHEPARPEFARMGMWLLIAALGMLFAASVVGTLVVRSRAQAWPPPGTPDVTGGLWLSTFLLLLSSGTVASALGAVRRGNQIGLRRDLRFTLLLGFGFLASQSFNWWRLVSASLTVSSHLFGFTFYVLTGLHAVHVLGGLIPLSIVAWRAGAGRYTASNPGGLVTTAMYWHFLDVVWLALFALFILG